MSVWLCLSVCLCVSVSSLPVYMSVIAVSLRGTIMSELIVEIQAMVLNIIAHFTTEIVVK